MVGPTRGKKIFFALCMCIIVNSYIYAVFRFVCFTGCFFYRKKGIALNIRCAYSDSRCYDFRSFHDLYLHSVQFNFDDFYVFLYINSLLSATKLFAYDIDQLSVVSYN